MYFISKMKSITFFTALFCLLFTNSFGAPKLQPGFCQQEYIELLKISAKNYDREATLNIPAPANFKMLYRSPVIGLENAWELWMNPDSIGVISIRPTINSNISWLTNVYATMVPAKGTLTLSENEKFDYKLADHPEAAVHVGWLIGMAFLSKDILPRIDSCYQAGIKEFYIVGHSQGGGISYLLTAYLYNLQKDNEIPQDIKFKTYCSAAPKPGNLYFAYEFENMTKGGKAFNVVNINDWVPETPFTVQTMDDFAEVDVESIIEPLIKKQKFPRNIIFRNVYKNNIDKPARKTLKKYQNFMGKKVSKPIKKHLTGFESPEYFYSNNYVRTGQTIVLIGDEEYFRNFPHNKEKFMIHHHPGAYLYLAEKMPVN